MDHLEAIVRTRVVRLPLRRAHCGAQRQATDPTHAVDADFHLAPLLINIFRIVEL